MAPYALAFVSPLVTSGTPRGLTMASAVRGPRALDDIASTHLVDIVCGIGVDNAGGGGGGPGGNLSMGGRGNCLGRRFATRDDGGNCPQRADALHAAAALRFMAAAATAAARVSAGR